VMGVMLPKRLILITMKRNKQKQHILATIDGEIMSPVPCVEMQSAPLLLFPAGDNIDKRNLACARCTLF
jgi:hypothetical protein